MAGDKTKVDHDLPGFTQIMGGSAGRGIDITPREISIGLLSEMLSAQFGTDVHEGNLTENLQDFFGAGACCVRAPD